MSPTTLSGPASRPTGPMFNFCIQTAMLLHSLTLSAWAAALPDPPLRNECRPVAGISANRTNDPPVVSHLRAVFDAGKKEVTVTYDLHDQEGDKVQVTFGVMDPARKMQVIHDAALDGDVGKQVTAGVGKKIRWKCTLPKEKAALLIVKLVVSDDGKPNVNGLLALVNPERLKRTTTQLTGTRNYRTDPAKVNEVKKLITQRFSSTGVLTGEQPVTFKNYTGCNIIGRIPGSSASNKVFIVAAHYDSVEKSPGADDNASGVAGMLEIMSILSKYDFNHSIEFVGFDLEEYGYVGSRHFVSRLGADGPETVGGVINLDMIGYCSEEVNSQTFPQDLKTAFPQAYDYVQKNGFRANFVLSVANKNSIELGRKFEQCVRKYVPELPIVSLTLPDGQASTLHKYFWTSDHASFWSGGLKALSVGDTGSARNDGYHSPRDKVETINYTFMGNIVKGTLALVAENAGIKHSSSATCTISTH